MEINMEKSEFTSLLCDNFNANGLSAFLSPSNIDRFYTLTCLLMETNRRMNLTAIRDETSVISLHYADCLLAARWIPSGATLLDCGCGAGFPSLPLAIARPDLKITSLDSTAKKLTFVSDAARTLGLDNITVLAGRAEEFAADTSANPATNVASGTAHRRLRESFDVCTARAVARLNILSELCVPFVKPGGLFLGLKGAKGDEEYKEAAHALAVLGCPESDLHHLMLHTDKQDEMRTVLVAKKASSTPRIYPRSYATIVKKTL